MKKTVIRVLSVLLSLSLLAGCGGAGAASQAPAAPAAPAASQAPAQAAPSAEGKTYNFKFGHVDAQSNPTHLGAVKLVELLNEKAPGKWNITIYSDGQLGGAKEMTEAVQMGTLEMASPASSFVANFAPGVGIWDMPFLFRDTDHVDKVMDGEIGQAVGAEIETANIKFLDWWEVGFRCLANNARPVNSPDDVKGLRIRVMSNEIHQALFSALGADPVPMSLSDAYVANQQGTIDGQDNPLPGLYSISIYEICKYIAVTRHVYTPQSLIMSKKAWEEMTPEDQAIFMEAVHEATAWQRAELRRQEAEAAKNLEEKGCELTYPDTAPFAELMSGVYEKYPQYAERIAQIQEIK